MTSYLNQSEIDALQTSALSRKTPYMIRGVSMTQFSIARYYGAIKFNGEHYTYMPDTDELVRDDVLKFVVNMRKGKRQKDDSK